MNILRPKNKQTEERVRPQVVITNADLEDELGNWLHLRKARDISHAMSEILWSIGIDQHEICVLEGYDEETQSFYCYLKNSEELTSITLERIHDLTFQFHRKNGSQSYTVFKKGQEGSYNAELYSYQILQKDKIFSRNFSDCNYRVTLENKERHVKINILDDMENPVLQEDALTEKLLQDSFPRNIWDVLTSIKKALKISIGDIPKIEINITDKIQNKENAYEDAIVLEYGVRQSISIRTRNQSITLLSPFSSYINYQSNCIHMIEGEDETISIKINGINGDMMSTMSLNTIYNDIMEKTVTMNKNAIRSLKRIEEDN